MIKYFFLSLGIMSWIILSGEYPLAYDTIYNTVGDSVVCCFTLERIPSGTKLLIGKISNDGSYEKYVTNTIKSSCEKAKRDSIIFFAPGFEEQKAVLKLEIDGLTFCEMVYVPAGRYFVQINPEEIEQYSLSAYWISKREISNNQFKEFIKNDGYETEDYWIIENGLMKNKMIGWHYQGSRPITKPYGWDFQLDPWYAETNYPGDEDPVTGTTWFEAYAYCRWMNSNLPTYEQLVACFTSESDVLTFEQKNKSVLQVNNAAAEWTSSGIDPTAISCGNCNEMRLLENSDICDLPYPMDRYSCPLYRNSNLGFRLVVLDNP